MFLALSAAILNLLFLALSPSHSLALPLPFFPAIITVPCPLPLPNHWFLHSQTHRSFRKPTRQNWQTDERKGPGVLRSGIDLDCTGPRTMTVLVGWEQ